MMSLCKLEYILHSLFSSQLNQTSDNRTIQYPAYTQALDIYIVCSRNARTRSLTLGHETGNYTLCRN